MIQVQSLLDVSDNSGCRTARCIKLIHGFKNKWGSCGDLILVSILKFKKGKKLRAKIQKGSIVHAVILRTNARYRRKDSSFIRFHDNSIVLLNKQLRPIGTRIIGPVLRELRKNKFMKVASVSNGFI